MIRPLILLTSLAALSLAEAAPLKAFIIYDERKFETAWVTGANASSIAYKVAERATAVKSLSRTKFKSLYFVEPESFSMGMAALRNADYDTALTHFTACEKEYKIVDSLPGNYHTLAGFYKLECYRLKGDLATLETEMDKYQPRNLKRKDLLAQLKINETWLAVHSKEWDRLSRYGAEQILNIENNAHRAQMGYCWALACENVNPPQTENALTGYAYAITADYAASQKYAKDAVERTLRILKDDEGVIQARKFYGTDDERRTSPGHLRLLEAGALANAYTMMFGKEALLPQELAEFQKYGSK